MLPCAIPWCLALACPDGIHCAVHRTRPKFRAVEGRFTMDAWCEYCQWSGVCRVCKGEGDHRCRDLECDAWHTCGACEGSGDCECGSPRADDNAEALTKNERRWLEWAYASVPAPTPFILDGIDWTAQW